MKPSRDSASLRSPTDMYSSRLFAVHEEWRLLFSCGHWDQSFKVTSLDSGKLLQSVTHHRDVVTCLALAQDMGRHWLVTGSRDCTVVVWEISPDKDAPVPPTPVHVLYGHDDAVNCVAVLAELDLIVSGSDDGTVIVYTLREGQYVQSITTRARAFAGDGSSSSTPTKEVAHPSHTFHEEVTSFARTRIHWVGLSRQGYLCSYSQDDTTICTYTINGRFLARRDANEQLHAFTFSEDGNVLLCGGQKGEVVFYWVRTLELADNAQRKGFVAVLNGAMSPSEGGSEGNSSTSQVANNSQPFGAPIRSLKLTRLERHLLVGLQNGMMYILAQDSDYLRQRLQKKLVEIGIL
jgi:WD40 repeat protein